MGGKRNRPKTKWRKVSIGNEKEKGQDQSAEEAEPERHQDTYAQNGDESANYEDLCTPPLTNGEEFEHLPIFQQTPEGLVHIPQNGFLPFPVMAPPMEGAPPLAEVPEGGVGGCYVNGLWIPNSELFKYGINPPPSAVSSTLVYHPNVPWVRLRPVPGPPGGQHHNQHHQHHHDQHHHDQQLHDQQFHSHPVDPAVAEDGPAPLHQVPMPAIPPNSQYLLYFTRKPPPWYQTHPRDRDHNWRRRNGHPSPYWSFNHASVHHPPPPPMEWNGEEFGALSNHNETGPSPAPLEDQPIQQVPIQQCNNYEPPPYIYPGYSFGQPVFTAPVFPVPKSVSESRSSRESPATSRSDGESPSVPQDIASPESVSSRPSLSSDSSATVQEVKEELKETPVVTVKVEEAAEESATSKLLLSVAPSIPVVVSSPESNQTPRSKKKKKRKKSRASDMEKQTDCPKVPTEPVAAKPDSLDLTKKDPVKPPSTGKLSNGDLPNFKIDLAGPSQRSSLDEEDCFPNSCPNTVILSKPFLEFADNLLRGSLELARKEIAEHHGREVTVADSQSLQEVPRKNEGDAELASTLASTLGLNTSPDAHGTGSLAGGTLHSNLEQNLRGTFAEKLAEQVIRDTCQERAQSGHRPEYLSLPVATSAFEPVSPNVEDRKTTATVEDSPALEKMDVERSPLERNSFDWNGLDADTSFSQLHRLIKPDSKSLKSVVVRDRDSPVTSSNHLDDSCSDGIGRSGQNLNPDQAFHLEESRHTAPDFVAPPLDLSLNLDSVADSFRNRILEEFADRMLYEIAVSIKDELVKGAANGGSENENDQFEKGSNNTDSLINPRRPSREFESLGSESGYAVRYSPGYQRRYSVDSFGGERYVDETTANYLAHLLPSDTLIRETEQELKNLQSRVLGSANHSIYKLAYDEVITDQSETDDYETSPFTSLTSVPELPLENIEKTADEDPILIKDFIPQRYEIMVHEADSTSEAGSEDVELIPHRYETSPDKHIYVNKLSLATELLRTKEELPYDDEFKPVTEEPSKSNSIFSGSDKARNETTTGETNPGFVGDEMPLRVITSGPRASTMSTADSGVQSEENSGDELAEEAIEGQKDHIKDATTSEEDQGQASKGYRRMGPKTRLGTMQGGAPWDPCLCCCVM